MLEILFVSCLAALALLLLPYVCLVAYWMIVVPAKSLAMAAGSGFNDVMERYEGFQVQFGERQRMASARNRLREIAAKHLKSRGFLKRHDTSAEATTLLLRERTGNCCKILLFCGRAYGVQHLRELEGSDIWEAYRANTLDALSLAVSLVPPRAVMEEASVAMKVITLDMVRDRCAHCPMLEYTPVDAPVLCEPARMFGNHES